MLLISKNMSIGTCLALMLASLVSAASADPLAGEVLKFSQAPMVDVTLGDAHYFGHDEVSTAYHLWTREVTSECLAPATTSYAGRIMADDFADAVDGPVVHVRWWGSYLSSSLCERTRAVVPPPVTRFLITFFADVPAQPSITAPAGLGTQCPREDFSHPGQTLLTQVVTRDAALTTASGTFVEKLISAGGEPLHEGLYEYNAELAIPFEQQPNTVYWLSIVALVDLPTQMSPVCNNGTDSDSGTITPLTVWGWHNRNYLIEDTLASGAVKPGERVVGSIGPKQQDIWHFQDDAVSGCMGHLLQTAAVAGEPQFGYFDAQNYRDGLDGPCGISRYSKDLAFELYTVPEPASIVITGLAAFMCLPSRRRMQAIRMAAGAMLMGVGLNWAAPAGAVVYNLSDPAYPGLAARVEFTLQDGGNTLKIALKNTSTGVPDDTFDNSDQLLTGVSFDLGAAGANAGDPAITGGTVVVGSTSQSLNFSILDRGPDEDVSGEWGYGNDDGTGALRNFVSTITAHATRFPGANLDGPEDLDGPQAGLIAASMPVPLGGLGAIKDEVIITLTLSKPLNDLCFLDQNFVRVEFGSDAAFITTPEPATLVMTALAGYLCLPRRRHP